MAVSESGAIIQELVGQGLNYASIGRALGRDRSLIRQVGVGSKPGANLAASLAELRERVSRVGKEAAAAPVTEPARRTTRAGTAARTRKALSYEGRGFATKTVKRQGSRSGGKSLAGMVQRAAAQGRSVAVTITFDKKVNVQAYGSSKRAKSGAGGSLDLALGDADELLEAAGDGITAHAVAVAYAGGYLSGVSSAAEALAHVEAVELRSY